MLIKQKKIKMERVKVDRFLFLVVLLVMFFCGAGEMGWVSAFSQGSFSENPQLMKRKIVSSAGNAHCDGMPPVLTEGVLLGGAGEGNWEYANGNPGSCEWTCKEGYSKMKYACLKNNQ